MSNPVIPTIEEVTLSMYRDIPYNNLLNPSDQINNSDSNNGGNCEYLCKYFLNKIDPSIAETISPYFSTKDGDVDPSQVNSFNHVILYDDHHKLYIEVAGNNSKIYQLKDDYLIFNDLYGTPNIIIKQLNFIYHFRSYKKEKKLVCFVLLKQKYSESSELRDIFIKNVIAYPVKCFSIRYQEGPPLFSVKIELDDCKLKLSIAHSIKKKLKRDNSSPFSLPKTLNTYNFNRDENICIDTLDRINKNFNEIDPSGLMLSLEKREKLIDQVSAYFKSI